MLIAFWSPFPNIGTSASALAVSAGISMNKEHHTTSLLLHSTLRTSAIEHAYNLQFDSMVRDKGMEAVNRLAKMNLLTADTLKDYTDSVIKRRLDVIPVTNSHRENIQWEGILKAAQLDYNYVFVDIQHSTNVEVQEVLVNQADLIFICIPQNLYKVSEYMNLGGLPSMFKNKKYVFLLSQYDSESTVRAKTLNRLPAFKNQKVLHVPYAAKFKDAMAYSKIQEFFFRTLIREEKNKQAVRMMKDLKTIASFIHNQRYYLKDEEDESELEIIAKPTFSRHTI